MRGRRQGALAIEVIFLLFGTGLELWLDFVLNLSGQFWNLANNPPPNGSVLFAFLYIYVGFHVVLVAWWLRWGYKLYKYG